LKIAILSTKDIAGGAARATYRLHQGLISQGLKSIMLVNTKLSDDFTVVAPKKRFSRFLAIFLPYFDLWPIRKYKNHNNFSTSYLPDKIIKRLKNISFDIIHLNWINSGYINIKTLGKLNYPIVWTLHDMWAFTGGCHYAGTCLKYQSKCSKCPVLRSNKINDISSKIFRRKIKYWKDLNLTIVCPSNWLANCAKKSMILRNFNFEVIPYNIDINVFKPIQKDIARNILNLPKDRELILFGALSSLKDLRKGIQYLLPALRKISTFNKEEIMPIVFGSSKPEKPIDKDIEVMYLGEIKDDFSLALIYSACDVFVAPSTEDNLPLTVMESLACGTPVVAFNIGGMPDMIDHRKNGYLAVPFNEEDLVQGILWVIKSKERKLELSLAARQKVLENFETSIIIEKYKSIYSRLLNSSKLTSKAK
jgi:glycosyltransferase involved in cell wall biosynthesis